MITVLRNKWVFEEVTISNSMLLQLRRCGRECFPTVIGWIWSKESDPETGDCTLTLRAILSNKDYYRFLALSGSDDDICRKITKYDLPDEVFLDAMPFIQEYVQPVGKYQGEEVLKVIMKSNTESV